MLIITFYPAENRCCFLEKSFVSSFKIRILYIFAGRDFVGAGYPTLAQAAGIGFQAVILF